MERRSGATGLTIVAYLTLVIAATTFPGMSRAAWFTGIGVLPDCFDSSAAALSADGTAVVGYGACAINAYPDYIQALRWTRASGLTTIPMTFAFGVSADGAVVVGSVDSSGPTAVRWTAESGRVALGKLRGDDYSEAVAVSADGAVAVGWSQGYAHHEAFRWTEAGGMVGLGFLPAGDYSYATGVSGDGAVVVGVSRDASGRKAFRWTSAEGMVGLGFLPGATESTAEATSADGSVVVGSSGAEAFRWTASDGMTSLGPGDASAVSADGTVVVGSSPSGVFVWDATYGMRSLQAILSNTFGLDVTSPGLVTPLGVSSDGRTVAGHGIVPSGVGEGWIATLLPDCSDGFDNDGDGRIDVDGGASVNHGVALGPADAGCPFPEARPENPQCDDGIDNDGNGLVDFADPKCSPAWPYWEKTPTLACGIGAELSIAVPLLIGLRRARGARS